VPNPPSSEKVVLVTSKLIAVPPADTVLMPIVVVEDVVAGREDVTDDLASRLASYFGTTADVWTTLRAPSA